MKVEAFFTLLYQWLYAFSIELRNLCHFNLSIPVKVVDRKWRCSRTVEGGVLTEVLVWGLSQIPSGKEGWKHMTKRLAKRLIEARVMERLQRETDYAMRR